MSYDNGLIGTGLLSGQKRAGGFGRFRRIQLPHFTNTIGALMTVEGDVPQALP